ncbi:MAG: CopD family protein [Gemmatimonadaceae bacterium]|nr:CopD family protein [Gemmatimonadaceae bacterium]
MSDPFEFAGGTATAGLRAIALTGTMVAIGAVAFRVLVAPRAAFGSAASEPVARLGRMGALLVLLAAPVRVWVQASGLAMDPGDTWGLIPRVLGTDWGRGAIAQAAAALLAVVAFSVARSRDRAGWLTAAVAAVGLAVAPGAMGHPIADEAHRAQSMAADALHVAGASAWIGALLPLALFARAGNAALTATLIRAFHKVAMASVALVVLSGAGSTLRRSPNLPALVHSGWGATLGVKLALVAVILALGAYHLRSGEQRASAGQPVGRTLAAELLVALAVLAVTGVLTGTEPPAGS